MRIPALLVLLIIFTTGCSSFKSSFDPGKKYSSEQLEKDYSIFQNILQESHPVFTGILQKIAWIITLTGERSR